MAVFICNKSLMHVFITTVMISAMEAQTQCSSDSQLESSGPIGESVYFYICSAAYPGVVLSFDEDSGYFTLPAETLTDGWYWESVGLGAGSYINITFTIAAAENFTTYRISYITEDLIAVVRTLTVSHQGPPQLCETEDPSAVYTLSAPIGSSDSSTLCVVSGSALTLSKVQPQTCQEKTTDTPSFDVTPVQNTSNPVVYTLEFSVSSLIVADIGQWTVNVNNDDGSLTIEVEVEAVGPPMMCGASQDLNLYLECEGSTASVFIFSRDALDWEAGELTSVENSSCTSFLGVNIETKDATSLTQELVVTATCDETSTWSVTVSNSYGDLEIEVTVGKCTSTAMDAQTQCSTDIQLESSGPIGESVYFYICGAAYPGAPLTFDEDSGDFSLPAETLTDGWYWESVGSGDGSYIKITFTITAAENVTTYTFSYITENLNAVIRTLTVSHQGPPQLCETEDPSSAHTLSAAIGSSNSSTLCVVSGIALTLSKVQPQTCRSKTTDTPSFDVTAVQNSNNPVVYELEFSVSSLTVADIGQWTVNVDNDYGSLTKEVDVEAVGPPMVCGDCQDLNLYLECEESKTSLYIFSQDALDLEVWSKLTSAENLSCTSSLGVNIETKDTTSLTQELVVTATCDEASTWRVTVRNSYGELEIGVTVGICTSTATTTFSYSQSIAPVENKESFKWLALGVGIASLLIIIGLVVIIIVLVKKIKRLNAVKKYEPSNGADDGRDAMSTNANISLNNLEPAQRPNQPSNYETILDTTSNSSSLPSAAPGEYIVADGGNLNSQTRSDYVTADSDLNVPTTSRYETVSSDFPFSPGTTPGRTLTFNIGQSGPYGSCNSDDTEPSNVYPAMDNGNYVNHGVVPDSEGARETYANVASAYENAA